MSVEKEKKKHYLWILIRFGILLRTTVVSRNSIVWSVKTSGARSRKHSKKLSAALSGTKCEQGDSCTITPRSQCARTFRKRLGKSSLLMTTTLFLVQPIPLTASKKSFFQNNKKQFTLKIKTLTPLKWLRGHSLRVQPSPLLGLPQISNLWEEEEARQLYELRGNEVIVSRFRRRIATRDMAKVEFFSGIENVLGTLAKKSYKVGNSILTDRVVAKVTASGKQRIYFMRNEPRTKKLSNAEINARTRFSQIAADIKALPEEDCKRFSQDWKQTNGKFNGKKYATLRGYIVARMFAQNTDKYVPLSN